MPPASGSGSGSASGSASGSTPTARRTVAVTPSKLSPEGKEDIAPLRLPPGCSLEVEFEAKARTPPRLVLKEKKKQQLLWPLSELSRIEINARGEGEPCVRFWLRSDLEGQKAPSSAALHEAYVCGAYRPGPKVFYLQAREACELLDVLQQRKLEDDQSVAHLELQECGGGHRGGELDIAGSGSGSGDGNADRGSGADATVAALGLLRLNSEGGSSVSINGGGDASTSARSEGADGAGSSESALLLLPKSPAARECLIFVCAPLERRARALPHSRDEAIAISNSVAATIQVGGCAADVQQALQRGRGLYRIFVFTGHGYTKTLGFTDPLSGVLSAPEPEALAALLGAHGLTLVFLNGCETEALGRRVRAAGVPHVVCWRTPTEDGAAALFADAFFRAKEAHGRSCAAAFADACHTLRVQTRDGYAADGTRLDHDVPHYELRPPDEPPRNPEGFTMPSIRRPQPEPTPLPFAAGVPVLLSIDGDLAGDADGDGGVGGDAQQQVDVM